MHYYPHHIADFNNATRHLGRLERSIYRDCIEMYYDTESPLDGTDLERLQRRLLCHSDAEKVALDFILNEFFEEEGGIYMNGRCDREIATYKARDKEAAKKQDAANERKRRYRDDRRDMFAGLRAVGVVPDFNIKMDDLRALYSEHCQVGESSPKDDANGTSRERLADASGTTKIEPITKNQEPLTNTNGDDEKALNIPFDVFWKTYAKSAAKEKCEAKWKSLSNKVREQIMQHLPAYVASTPTKKFRKDPYTYLNDKGWLDDIIVDESSSNQQSKPSYSSMNVNAKYEDPDYDPLDGLSSRAGALHENH
ncbi:YdaU family protein [Psychrobacter sp. NZS113]|uniref:YdaU family protein n=1 Tax=Psychrobacter sp. NZS113 TaxID=2792045 RepID=UPI0018CE5138|nr:YdaU family protein [Psychrobacter sp. NZS113]MBH0095948.1 YdaU family protein [Psychrobacter sp. NZS113]